MAGAGRLTSAELAAKTGTGERYVREWLSGQAASGYVTYDAATGRYTLPDAHAAALTDEDSPACVLGGFQGMTAAMKATPKVIEAFRTGRRCRLARARSRALRRHGALLPSRLPRPPGGDPGSRRSTGWRRSSSRAPASPTSAAGTALRRSSWRRPSRARPSSASTTTQASIDAANERRAEGRHRRAASASRSATAKAYPGYRLRPRHLLRLPARHGRSGGCGAPRAPVARTRRHVHAGRAVRQRPASRTT